MPCACNGTPAESKPAEQFKVTLPDGSTKVVGSEHDAKVAVTMAGGGTFSRI